MEITTKEALRELYGWPKERTVDKVMNRLEKHSINFIAHAPFFVLSTHDRSGQCDASPRGGKPGFVKVLDNRTILIPDAKGNNRVDSLDNIVETSKVGCLFLIPGINETLRINGMAKISIAPDHLNKFLDEKIPPKACIEITINEVFLHCAKALMRSELWNDAHRIERPGFPTMGTMLNDQLGVDAPVESQEDMIKRYQKDL